MSLINKILALPEFDSEPPVLLDIGASGTIHKKWKKLAKYSICIGFDADSRDFKVTEDKSNGYKKLILKNSLVSDQEISVADFFLTKSPYCSSLLQPDTKRISAWAFAPLFQVDKVVKLKTSNLTSVLKECGIKQIDWFKCDTQGTDLRLFKSLEEPMRNKIIVAEFEPGILDAYVGEDKLHHVLEYMDSISRFWLSDLDVKGTLRINIERYREIFKGDFIEKLTAKVGRISAGWGEMTYLNSFELVNEYSKRDFLLGWVCSSLIGQHAFAYELAHKGHLQYGDPIFLSMKNESKQSVRYFLVTFKYFSLVWNKLMR